MCVCARDNLNVAHLVATGRERICGADEINYLVYTAHADTHSQANSHVRRHAWTPMAANTVIAHKTHICRDNGPTLSHMDEKEKWR